MVQEVWPSGSHAYVWDSLSLGIEAGMNDWGTSLFVIGVAAALIAFGTLIRRVSREGEKNHSYRMSRARGLVWAGVACLVIAVIDLIHTAVTG